ncbi:LOB domain-containing protein 40 [Dorcoceras hygrometricum]|uniref:LOB domain-containing protein 40 n=1 Tax=Dorcoceras hygrometricum TaxID=472368 RepID=A0A2Z7BI23_9LAMI|nr:LOB domain-containing protein 40 [Dorcoceras hygrometricum]
MAMNQGQSIFLAKFYGRAGLLNLIDSGPKNLRPGNAFMPESIDSLYILSSEVFITSCSSAIFRSLLYDACGRIVNPIDGSAGLLWSGGWQLCEDAVDAVLRGAPITRMASHAAAVETKNLPALKAACDIRHVSRVEHFPGSSDLHRVRERRRFKNSCRRTKQNVEVESSASEEPENSADADTVRCCEIELDLTLCSGAKPTTAGA